MAQVLPLPRIAHLQLHPAKAGRLMVHFPYHPGTVARIKTIPGRWWHPERKCWSVPYTAKSIDYLQRLFAAPQPTPEALPAHEPALTSAERAFLEPIEAELKLGGYSPATRKTYLNHLRRFRRYLRVDPSAAGELEVRQYLLYLLDEKQVSRAHHNQAVSALKFYYQRVLRQPMKVEELPRPRHEQKLPVVLSRQEVLRLFAALGNLKHKALLMLAYSAGLRVSEVVRLKVGDIDSERGLIRVFRAKGRKDRYTSLSQVALEVVRAYRQACKPEGWLFPGARQDQHLSKRSVQKVLALARKKTGLHKHFTMHTLRHGMCQAL